jgi:hypothetical protein
VASVSQVGVGLNSETSPKYRISGDRDSEVIAGHPHAPRRATPSGRPNPSPMEDCRVARLRALAVARPTEAARLNAEADVVMAARAAGQSLWGSELSPLFLRLVLEYLQWDPAVCGVMRAVCSTWCSLLDALLPRLRPRGSAAVMAGKLGWYQSVTEVNLTGCEEEDVSSVLAELGSMPCLRSLYLPASCAERAVDAEAVCGLTTLTTLRFYPEYDEDGELVEAGEWVLDLSRLTTLDIKGVQPDGQASAGAEQPHCTHHPQSRRLPQRVGRGAVCSEQPHRPHHLQPLAASELC